MADEARLASETAKVKVERLHTAELAEAKE